MREDHPAKMTLSEDHGSSEKIWREYHLRLRAYIRRRVHDDAACDDILQDVFLKMNANLASLKERTKLQGWLYRITANAISDYFRALRPVAAIADEIPQPEADAVAGARRELSACLQPMIERLPETYREAIILSELQGLTQKEVAKRQGISLAGAKSRVQRGRALLKGMLADCCRLEFDHGGRLCSYERKERAGDFCRFP